MQVTYNKAEHGILLAPRIGCVRGFNSTEFPVNLYGEPKGKVR